MKIGILTFHNAFNYGAILQAYALQQFLKSLGYDVEILNYCNEAVEKSYTIFKFSYMPKKRFWRIPKYIATSILKRYKFRHFKENVQLMLNISNKIESIDDRIMASKDVIIIGSDQLWNRKITRIFDPFYWGEFSKKIKGKVITYAVSMNFNKLSTKDVLYIKEHLNNFTSISVRERSLAEVLIPLTKMPVYVSLDPTLMVDRNMWMNLIKYEKPLENKPYVLVYAILERKKVIENAKKIAITHKMPLIVMNPIADVDPFKNYYQPTSPMAFVSAIAHAKCIVTSSFHGMAFSVILNKTFFVMGDSGKNERMISLLRSLGIENRFVKSLENVNIGDIDYEKVNNKLDLLRDESKSYLINAIK